jgi:hypothetical protein
MNPKSVRALKFQILKLRALPHIARGGILAKAVAADDGNPTRLTCVAHRVLCIPVPRPHGVLQSGCALDLMPCHALVADVLQQNTANIFGRDV